MSEQIRWGILGTGKIARILANALAASEAGRLVAVASRTAERADRFASEFRVPRAHAEYASLVDDPEIDLIYVATHHPSHRRWAVAAAEAGKHVLCEKPLAVDLGGAREIVEAAERNDVLLLEAFAYRCHPQTGRLLGILSSGAIGEIRVIDAVFGYDAGPSPANYLLVRELAGGAILDVGCYTTSMSHLIAGAAAGHAVEADEVSGVAVLGPTGVDLSSGATISFEGGALARVACSIQANLDSTVRVYGSEGRLTVTSPWLPGRIGSSASIVVERHGAEPEVVDIPLEDDVYTVEVDAVNSFVAEGQRSTPAMTWAESLANMRTLDMWREAAGVELEVGSPDDSLAEAGGLDR